MSPCVIPIVHHAAGTRDFARATRFDPVTISVTCSLDLIRQFTVHEGG